MRVPFTPSSSQLRMDIRISLARETRKKKKKKKKREIDFHRISAKPFFPSFLSFSLFIALINHPADLIGFRGLTIGLVCLRCQGTFTLYRRAVIMKGGVTTAVTIHFLYFIKRCFGFSSVAAVIQQTFARPDRAINLRGLQFLLVASFSSSSSSFYYIIYLFFPFLCFESRILECIDTADGRDRVEQFGWRGKAVESRGRGKRRMALCTRFRPLKLFLQPHNELRMPVFLDWWVRTTHSRNPFSFGGPVPCVMLRTRGL